MKSKKCTSVSTCFGGGFILLALLFTSCTSYYKNLQPAGGDVSCIRKFSPHFSNTLYSAYVDVTRHHFSGILFFKSLPDSSIRVVFTNEMGVKFFDFAFTHDNHFVKYYVMHKMDKKAVVTALRKDLQLVLMQQDLAQATSLKDSLYDYTAIPNVKGNDYYITDNCERLVRIEKSSKRKPVVVAQMLNYKDGIPDSIDIRHENFKFEISLKHVER